MEAINTSFHLLQLLSSTSYTRTKRRMDVPYSSWKFQRKLPTQAQMAFMDTTAIVAVDSPGSFGGGNISVLIPVSAVLLFVYWIANFVVPGIVIKDFVEPEESDRENIED